MLLFFIYFFEIIINGYFPNTFFFLILRRGRFSSRCQSLTDAANITAAEKDEVRGRVSRELLESIFSSSLYLLSDRLEVTQPPFILELQPRK